MSALIDRRGVVDDRWTTVGDADPIPERGDVIVPFARWKADRVALRARSGRLGVVLGPEEGPASVANDLDSLALIAVHFPHFTDGRGYSTARLLRERFGFEGELRATGDVGRDQLFYLGRVGFDTFALRPGEDPRIALQAFDDFAEGYQTSVERPYPLFRRRPRPPEIEP